jgi:hypothetical protein
MTKRELEAEVERLRDEVAFLRAQQAAHVCAQPQMPVFPAPGCTCGTSMGCQAHPYPKPTIFCRPYQSTFGAAGVPQTVMVKPGQEYTVTGMFLAAGCAAAAPQILTFNVPA